MSTDKRQNTRVGIEIGTSESSHVTGIQNIIQVALPGLADVFSGLGRLLGQRQVARPATAALKERKVIKGLRPFGFDDAEIFARLQRQRDWQACLEVLTQPSLALFRFGILTGESECGKTSFLQAGIWPQLSKPESPCRAVYVRLTNQPPLQTIRNALVEQLEMPTQQLPSADRETAYFLTLLEMVVTAAGKPVVLLLDQFEQFFAHQKRAEHQQPFIQTLAAWYRHDPPLAVKIMVSIRADILCKLIDLEQAMQYRPGLDHRFLLK